MFIVIMIWIGPTFVSWVVISPYGKVISTEPCFKYPLTNTRFVIINYDFIEIYELILIGLRLFEG